MRNETDIVTYNRRNVRKLESGEVDLRTAQRLAEVSRRQMQTMAPAEPLYPPAPECEDFSEFLPGDEDELAQPRQREPAEPAVDLPPEEKRAKRKFTEAEREEHCRRYLESGLTQHRYAEEHDIGQGNLSIWLGERRMRKPTRQYGALRQKIKITVRVVGWTDEQREALELLAHALSVKPEVRDRVFAAMKDAGV